MITRFQFEDLSTGWKLEEASFDRFNLLVGLSGAGKTKILEAIAQASFSATEPSGPIPNCRWKLTASRSGFSYTWNAHTGDALHDSKDSDGDHAFFRSESIAIDGKTVAQRNDNKLIFQTSVLPVLSTPQSLISLFQKEPLLNHLYETLKSISISAGNAEEEFLDDQVSSSWEENPPGLDLKNLKLEDLRRAEGLPLSLRIVLLQRYFPSEFKRVHDAYTQIFPSVEAIGFAKEARKGKKQTRVYIALKERGVPHLIEPDAMSSGMFSTLLYLFELALAPHGSILLLDELENSLGYNCIDPVSEALLGDRPDIQFIITSHHPYILNRIPRKHWKLVHREGSAVTIRSASEIPELDTRSAQDSYSLLLRYYDRLREAG